MNSKFLIVTSLWASLAISMPVQAVNDGHLDGIWLSGRVKTKIPKAFHWAGQGPWHQSPNIFVDSGVGYCYAQLTWRGVNSFEYALVSYCLNGNSQWERGEFNTHLFEINDGKQTIATDWGELYFPQKGKFLQGFPKNYAFTGYDGGFLLTPKYDKKGNLKRIKIKLKIGMVYSYDSGIEVAGLSKPSGIKLKYVKTELVPQGARDCAAVTALTQTALCPFEDPYADN